MRSRALWVALAAGCSLGALRCSLAPLGYLRDDQCAPNCGALDGGSDSAPSDTLALGDERSTSDVSPTDAADGPVYVNPGIACRQLVCQPATELCCDLQGCGQFAFCATRDAEACTASNCGGIIFCDDTADCVAAGLANTVCCGSPRSSSSDPIDSVCLPLGSCRSSPHEIYCDPDAPTPCPSGALCVVPDSGSGFATCAGL